MSAPASCETAPLGGALLPALLNVVGISEDVPTEDRIRRLLLQLDDAEFLPPPAWHDAIELLAADNPAPGLNTSASPALCREIEDALRAEIDEFAGRFFSISPADRRLQWEKMARRASAGRSARARLALLEPAIDIEPPVLEIGGNPRATRLADLTMQLFPLDASSRRQRIGCALGTMLDEPHDWENAAHHLAAVRSELAALVPEFLGTVTRLCDHEREKARRHAARDARRSKHSQWGQEYHQYDLAAPPGRQIFNWLMWIFFAAPLAVLIVLQIIGLFKGPGQPEPIPMRSGAGDIKWPPPSTKKMESTRRRKTRPSGGAGEFP